MKKTAVALSFFLSSMPSLAEEDRFNGDQLLYELTYDADYESSFVGYLLTFSCTGQAAPFIIAKLPNPSLVVKNYMLGFYYGGLNRNPYTGSRFPDSDDPRRPGTNASRAAEEMLVAARAGDSVDYLCDIFLWDAFEDYANAQVELTRYVVERLRETGREEDVAGFIAQVEPELRRLEKLVNGDPSGSRDWSGTSE